jgi:pimeloyl-ACP methyl ester carboxylesterase
MSTLQDTPPLRSGVITTTVATSRLNVRVLASGPADGEPVVFLHGNVSGSRFWEETMLALPPRYRAVAPDLRGFGGSDPVPVDATRGLRDFADDLAALAAAATLPAFHLVGWSMGGGIAMQYAIDHADRLRSITLVNPLPPVGFGGTRGSEGTPIWPDFAGSGGGTANPEFVKFLAAGERGAESPFAPRAVMRQFYFRPPFMPTPEREEAYLSAMLATRTGDDFYPGDHTPSPHWPGVAPGTRGVNNAMSPKYCNLRPFAGGRLRVPVLWIRGADDQIVSNASLFDFGTLGQVGLVPGWPGAEIYPPQPMVDQTRALLERYAAAGGSFTEEVFEETGHSPHVERSEQFIRVLVEFLDRTSCSYA